MSSKDKTIRLIVSQECYDEFQILSIRTKKSEHDLMREVLEKHADKKKEKVQDNLS